MSIVRSTLMVCLTLAVSVVMVLFYVFYQNRYEIVGHNNGIYVLDRKDSVVNYCDGQKCRQLNPLDPLNFYKNNRNAIVISQDQMQNLNGQSLITPNQGGQDDGGMYPSQGPTGMFPNSNPGSMGRGNNAFSAATAQGGMGLGMQPGMAPGMQPNNLGGGFNGY